MPYLSGRGISQETADRFLLGLDEETGRLAIPYLTPAGPIQIRQRCIQNHNCKEFNHPKYDSQPGAPTVLYNAQTLFRARAVMIVEGEIDTMTIEQMGIPAVGIPGTGTWGPNSYWAYCFDSVDDVFIVGDGDPPSNKGFRPGEALVNEIAKDLHRLVSAEIHTAILPEGEDANSFINKYGEDEFLRETGWL